jgi:hypothetical protein
MEEERVYNVPVFKIAVDQKEGMKIFKHLSKVCRTHGLSLVEVHCPNELAVHIVGWWSQADIQDYFSRREVVSCELDYPVLFD